MNDERILDTMDEEAYREILAQNKSLQARVKELEGRLGSAQDINDNHQRYNSKLQISLTEVQEDNKKLAHQVEDQLDKFRKSGGM